MDQLDSSVINGRTEQTTVDYIERQLEMNARQFRHDMSSSSTIITTQKTGRRERTIERRRKEEDRQLLQRESIM